VDRSCRLDQYCADAGRDPSTMRRSLLVYPRFVDAWADSVAAEALVGRFYEVGFTEFIFFWPIVHQHSVFELFADEVMPRLRALMRHLAPGIGRCSPSSRQMRKAASVLMDAPCANRP
jgi:hypothetical protein